MTTTIEELQSNNRSSLLPRASSAERSVFLLLLGLFTLYSALYIFRLSVVVDGVRYFMVADDQFVSMRYAENLARGMGLVWNAGGERVEGFTNPLWVAYMTLFHWI